MPLVSAAPVYVLVGPIYWSVFSSRCFWLDWPWKSVFSHVISFDSSFVHLKVEHVLGEKIRNRSLACTNSINETYRVNESSNSTPVYLVSTATNIPCRPDGTILNASTSMWASFTYLFFIIHGLVYVLKRYLHE